MIDRSRGHPALRQFFKDEFAGTLVTDFWGAYNAVACTRAEMPGAFASRVKDGGEVRAVRGRLAGVRQEVAALLGDAIRLKKLRGDGRRKYASRRAQLSSVGRVDRHGLGRGGGGWLIKRLRRHRDELLTFLDHEECRSTTTTGSGGFGRR